MLLGQLRLELLGRFHLCQGDQPVGGFEHARLQHLLAYLALHRSAPISRQQLAYLFWPDSTDQQALKNLRTLLTRLRQALPDVDCYIDITIQSIRWRLDAPFTLDVAEFEAALAQEAAARQAGEDVAIEEALAAAVELYAGDLLPDCYAEWILPLREHLHQACCESTERLVLLLEEQRQYTRALTYARYLLNHDSLSESAYHHLIQLNLALGERTEAFRMCKACDAMLEHEFGAAPLRPTCDRYQHLLEFQEPPVWQLMENPSRTLSSNPPLVGRKVEWSRLVAAWRAAVTGRPQMVLISGDAGIGKTRLADELCGWVSLQGAVVAKAHCYPAGGSAVAYAPLVEWLRDEGLRTRLATLEDVWLVEIARILPALLADRTHLKPPGPLTEAWQRTRLFEALTRALLGTDDHPLLLFLDDLQWCDQETIDWLGYLLRFSARAPLLIVATVRKFEIDRVHPLMKFWLSLARSSLLREIALDPLEATDTGVLAAQVAGRAMDAAEAAQIYRDSEGYPLFVVEMVRAGMVDEETGRNRQKIERPVGEKTGEGLRQHSLDLSETSLSLTFGHAALPPKVRAVIQWRLAQLSPVAQALAQIAAVIGRSFSLELLVKASGQDEQVVVEGLEEMWQRHLVNSQEGSDYNFSHDGIRAVAYDDAVPIRRSAIHLRVARILEEIHPESLDAFSLQIATHYEQAGLIRPAITFYLQAASVADRVYAHAVAANLYRRLLESKLSQGLTDLERCNVELALAEVWRATGQWAQAETISRNAMVEAETLGEAHLATRARCVYADLLHLLGYYDLALRQLAEAEQGFRAAGDWRGVANSLWIAGEIYWLRGDHSQALTALEQQLKISSEIDEPGAICEGLQAIGTVLWSEGDWARAADYCLKSIRIASPLEIKPLLTRAAITLGNIRAAEGWFGEAAYWYLYAGALARDIDDRRALSLSIAYITSILAKRGDDERAMAGYERSLRVAWEIGDRWTACMNVAGLAAIHEHLGRAKDAEMLYRRAIEFGLHLGLPGFVTNMLVNLARFLLEQGRADEAQRIYHDAMSQIPSLAGEETLFQAQVLGIRLGLVLGEMTGPQAETGLRNLLIQAAVPSRQARLHYELWRLAPEDEISRAEAESRYRTIYTERGEAESRKIYQELSGDLLPDPPPLPDVSELIPDPHEMRGLTALLDGVEALFK